MTIPSNHPDPYSTHTVQTSLSQLAQYANNTGGNSNSNSNSNGNSSISSRRHPTMSDPKAGSDARKQKSTNGKIQNKNAGLGTGKGSDAVFSDTLYLENLAHSVTEQDILDLMKSFDSLPAPSVQLYRDSADHGSSVSGCVRFASYEQADRAYVLFNGNFLPQHDTFIKFRINDPAMPDPEPQATMLQVKQLPALIDSNSLYTLFRKFGPMSSCKIIADSTGLSKGSAFIQYFRQQDADDALEHMHCKEIDNKTIAITKFTPGKSKSPSAQSASVPIPVNPSAAAAAAAANSSFKSLSPTAAPYTPPPSNISSPSAEDYVDPSTMLTPTMDPCNLYIKNLDPNVKSSDLFNSFRKFGRIISARVMNNPLSGQSKGFGFVSFSKPDEAMKALQEMNGKMILSKAIVVAYHEPKKVRAEKLAQQYPINGNGGAASPPHSQGPVSPLSGSFMPPQTAELGYNGQERVRSFSPPTPFGPPADASFNPGFASNLPPGPEPIGKDVVGDLYAKIAKLNLVSPAECDKIAAMLVADMNIGDLRKALSYPTFLVDKVKEAKQAMYTMPPPPPPLPSATPVVPFISVAEVPPVPSIPLMPNYNFAGRPSLRRRGSVESISSVLTDTSAIMQKKKMAEALVKIGETEDLENVVDMLLTLKRKDRSLCLFNPDILRDHVRKAREALAIFSEDDNELPLAPLTTSLSATTPATPYVHKSSSVVSAPTLTVVPPPKVSKAIPIVAPSAKQSPPGSTSQTQIPQSTEIEEFLKSIDGKQMHEKKQRLGDRLFPLVKATGVKLAPKVTIRLLDTIDLRTLAYSMYDSGKLKEMVDAASASLSS